LDGTGDEQVGGRPGGRFQPGQSGNPAGRPRGSRNRTSVLLEQLQGEGDKIIERVVKDALKGRAVALRLVVERLLPVKGSRDKAVALDIPASGRAGELVDAAAAVMESAAAGEITLPEAQQYMQLLESQRRLLETGELVERLEALERAVPAGGVDPQRRASLDRVRVILDQHMQRVPEGRKQ